MENTPASPVEQAAPPKPGQLLKKLTPSLLWAVFFGLMCSVQGGGFMVIFIIFPQIVLVPMRLFIGIMNPVDRWLNLGRVFIWVLTIATIYVVHHVREDFHRRYADEIVARIEAYSAVHGVCAAKLEDVGVSAQEFRSKLGYSGYYCEEGRQHFIYHGSFMLYSSWSYDFDQHSWHYRSD